MLSEDQVKLCLQQQVLNQWVQLGGEDLRLNVYEQGAELITVLLRDFKSEELLQALSLGFSGAIEFTAGLGIDEAGTNLTLAQWLPGVCNWNQAAPALESMLNQTSVWRAQLAPAAKPTINPRNEQRWRARLNQFK